MAIISSHQYVGCSRTGRGAEEKARQREGRPSSAKQKSSKKRPELQLPLANGLVHAATRLAARAGLPLVQCLEALQDQTETVFASSSVSAHDISQGNSFPPRCGSSPNPFQSLHLDGRAARRRRAAEILGKVAGYFESTVKLTKK